MRQLIALLQAIQFYTAIPVPFRLPWNRDSLNSATKFLPLLGAMQGGIIFALYKGLGAYFNTESALLFALFTGIFIMGAMNEEGLGRFFSLVSHNNRRSNHHPEGNLQAFGILILVFAVLFRWQLLIQIPSHWLWIVLISSGAFSQWNFILTLTTLPYIISEGTARPLPRKVSTPGFIFAFTMGILPFLFFYFEIPSLQLLAFLPATFSTLLLRWQLKKKFAGYTLDSLGAVEQISQISFLTGFVVLNHI